MNRHVARLITAALTGCLALAVATPATAQDDTTPERGASRTDEQRFAELRERCQAAVGQRLDSLARTRASIDGVAAVTEAHDAAIAAIVGDTEARLTALDRELSTATDRVTVTTLCATIAPDHRVYLVVLPQAHLTVGTDRVEAGVGIGRSMIGELDTAITAAGRAGADVTAAQAHRDASLEHLAAAEAATDGTADDVLAVTPASFDDGNGAEVLDIARDELRQARAELAAAEEAGAAAVAALREALADLD
ncbi:MAG: hypothetical protein R2707_12950 [Acidimicrobiales bacterium]